MRLVFSFFVLAASLCVGSAAIARADEANSPVSQDPETEAKPVVSSLSTERSYPNATWLSVGASPNGNISGAVGLRRSLIGIEIGMVGGGVELPSGDP